MGRPGDFAPIDGSRIPLVGQQQGPPPVLVQYYNGPLAQPVSSGIQGPRGELLCRVDGGLTKLEYVATEIFAADNGATVEQAVEAAIELLSECSKYKPQERNEGNNDGTN